MVGPFPRGVVVCAILANSDSGCGVIVEPATSVERMGVEVLGYRRRCGFTGSSYPSRLLKNQIWDVIGYDAGGGIDVWGV